MGRFAAAVSTTVALVGLLAAPAAGVGALPTPGPAVAATSLPGQQDVPTVTLVGSLQDELGCETEWDPACTDTAL
ncbi:MAG: hypothetical protein WA912_02760, partial [Ornithinimicrobium sp.]